MTDLHRLPPHPPVPAPQEQGRADFYALIAALLLGAPRPALLAALGGAALLPPHATAGPLERAWERLVHAARAMDADAVAEEYAALFVDVGTPQVDPYASRYLCGYMMDKPLAALRAALRELGLARSRSATHTEDHLGALCEVMRVLIAGAPGLGAQPLARQRQFFETHLAPWYRACLDDVRRAGGANFYGRVADFIDAWFEVEAEAFGIDETPEDGAAESGDVRIAGARA